MDVPIWTVYETAFEGTKDYENPFWDVDLQLRFTGPEGRNRVVDAFWDGGRAWRVRFSPDVVGRWRWETVCSDTTNAGLTGQAGEFVCTPYEGDNALYRYGAVRRSDDRSHFVWADGTPFFWLADTAWNGVLRSKPEDWVRYLQSRQSQGYSVIQFVSTQWRGGREVLGDERAYSGTDRIRVHPGFFRDRDAKVAAVNAYGLVAAPIVLWANQEDDPGQALPEPDALRLARYIIARWGAYQVIWLLGGDGNYKGDRAERWYRIGRTAFGEGRDRLVSMHPCGQSWIGDEFRGEPWFDFIGYQSGHGSSDEHLRWLVMGPPAKRWDRKPPLPVVNLEPNYEMHPSYHEGLRFTDYEVRRAAYWSLLVSPTAGVTYGSNPIWVWAEEPEIPEGHASLGTVEPWSAGLIAPGVRSMTVMRAFFETLPWWTLRPAPELLAEQPGEDDPRRYIAAARTEDGETTILYMPQGGQVQLRLEELPSSPVVCWFDPRSGDWTEACALPDEGGVLTAPEDADWVLCVRSGG